MIIYRQERLEDVWDEAQPLVAKHWEEIAHYKDIPLAPEKEMYFGVSKLGLLRVFTARIEGKLVGYCVFFVKRNPHYSTSLQATQDILFVLPEYRKGRVGIGLIKYCDQQLGAEDVQVVYQHVKLAHNFGPVLERMGYEAVDIIYAKRLN
jgi:GNAT superfamily N-acetyltransferase